MELTLIRRRLLLIAAMATAAIGAGALLQYRALHQQSERFAAIRADLERAEVYDVLASKVARERGLTLTRLLESPRTGASARGVRLARADVDDALHRAADPQDAEVSTERSRELALMRADSDAVQANPDALFERYSALVALLNDGAARRLSEGMIQIGLPYEHVNAKREAVERLARTRGLIAGALARGGLTPAQREQVLRQRVLFDDAMRRYALAQPPGQAAGETLMGGAALLALRQKWIALDEAPAQLFATTRRADWWPQATAVVDAFHASLVADTAALKSDARDEMAALDARIRWTVAALVVLGLLTVGLVLATFRRVVNGLDRLLGGIDRMTRERQLATRIEYRTHDEFGHISEGVNRLVEMVEGLVAERDARAQIDGLTGVLNRNGLDAQMDARLNQERLDSRTHGLLLVDVDHFKRINDTHGHLAGDAVLGRLGAVLRASVRSDDVVGRYGGEEFLVLLAGCRQDQLSSIAEKLRLAVGTEDFGLGVPVTVSVGAALHRVGDVWQANLKLADEALYRAKAAGRNRVVVAVLT